jgi:hypothetical protein
MKNPNTDMTLNIGMETKRGSNLSPEEVIAAVQQRFPRTDDFRLVPGDYQLTPSTEDTMVVRIHPEEAAALGADNYYGLIGRIYDLACDLRQDCIAAGGGLGKLIGPAADRWGRFEPSRFFYWHECEWVGREIPGTSHAAGYMD